ncbi:hypothetical protein PS2_036808 [Malus domestica]
MCVNLRAPWQGRLAKMPNLYSHSRKHSQQDCLLKNRRGTALRISRAKLPTGLLSQKSKRHRSLNLKSQTSNMIAFSKIDEALFSESQELDSRQDCLFENQRGTALQTSRARFPWIKLVCNLYTQHQLSRYHRPFFSKCADKVKTRESCSSHYIAMTEKGKGTALPLAV